MPLQQRHDLQQLVVGGLVDLLQVGEGHRVADPRDHVLTLGVLQVVPVDALGAGGRVAGEAHPGAGVRAGVAEHHRHHVHRRAQLVRDPLLAPVEHRPLGVPRREHRVDRRGQLLAGVLRELGARLLGDDSLERRDQLLHVVRVEVEVAGDALAPLELVERVLEPLPVDVLDGLAEHLDQPAVGVPREPRVVRLDREPVHRVVVEPDVEDGLHHPGHRELRPRPHRHQQGVIRVAQLLAPRRLQRRQVLGDLRVQPLGHGSRRQVGAARLRGDREPGGHGQAQFHHLRQVRPLTPEQVLLVLVTLGEVVDVARHCRPFPSSAARTVCLSDRCGTNATDDVPGGRLVGGGDHDGQPRGSTCRGEGRGHVTDHIAVGDREQVLGQVEDPGHQPDESLRRPGGTDRGGLDGGGALGRCAVVALRQAVRLGHGRERGDVVVGEGERLVAQLVRGVADLLHQLGVFGEAGSVAVARDHGHECRGLGGVQRRGRAAPGCGHLGGERLQEVVDGVVAHGAPPAGAGTGRGPGTAGRILISTVSAGSGSCRGRPAAPSRRWPGCVARSTRSPRPSPGTALAGSHA